MVSRAQMRAQKNTRQFSFARHIDYVRNDKILDKLH